MKTTIFFALLLITSTELFGQQTSKTIQVGSGSRAYIEFLPSNYSPNENLPLVLVLHGLGGNNSQMTAIGFNQIADTARCIVLYPQGQTNGFGQTAWNNGTALSSNANDVEFMNQLMNLYQLQYNVDPSKVYVTGFSMGGIMSHRLGLALNHRVAAIGAMAGTLSTPDLQNFSPTYQLPVIHLHGTEDGTVPYDSNPLPTLSLVPETMAYWRSVHGCDNLADSIRIADVANDNITIDRFVYNNCSADSAVELWRFNGADHIYLYEPLNDITESKVVWNFFRKWSHPSPSVAKIQENDPLKNFLVYPNPTNSVINFHLEEQVRVKIVAVDGSVIEEWEGQKGQNQHTLSPSEIGVYFFVTPTSITKFVR